MRETVKANDLARRPSQLLQSWRERRAAHRRAMLVSARHRRALAQGIRAVARAAADQTPPSRWGVLLRARAVPLRKELLEVAAMVERAQQPDVACIAALRSLLRDGGTSPLYNPSIDPRELAATLDYVRRGLDPDAPSPVTAGQRHRDSQ
jgi:hypothetical protein